MAPGPAGRRHGQRGESGCPTASIRIPSRPGRRREPLGTPATRPSSRTGPSSLRSGCRGSSPVGLDVGYQAARPRSRPQMPFRDRPARPTPRAGTGWAAAAAHSERARPSSSMRAAPNVRASIGRVGSPSRRGSRLRRSYSSPRLRYRARGRRLAPCADRGRAVTRLRHVPGRALTVFERLGRLASGGAGVVGLGRAPARRDPARPAGRGAPRRRLQPRRPRVVASTAVLHDELGLPESALVLVWPGRRSRPRQPPRPARRRARRMSPGSCPTSWPAARSRPTARPPTTSSCSTCRPTTRRTPCPAIRAGWPGLTRRPGHDRAGRRPGVLRRHPDRLRGRPAAERVRVAAAGRRWPCCSCSARSWPRACRSRSAGRRCSSRWRRSSSSPASPR